jgi:gamma-glutamyltranspeptidase
VIDRDGNIVSLIQSLYSSFGSGVVAPGTGVMLHNRGGLFTLEDGHPNQIAPRKRPLHTIIPAFMEKGDVKIGFGIMGGFNQAQAHAQFVSDIADFGSDVQEALEAGRFNKDSFSGCDVNLEVLVPEATRQGPRGARSSGADRTAALGYVRVRPGRDEQRCRRPLRRLRAETRRRRDPRSAAGVQEGRIALTARFPR